jgi:hypothetical protein
MTHVRPQKSGAHHPHPLSLTHSDDALNTYSFLRKIQHIQTKHTLKSTLEPSRPLPMDDDYHRSAPAPHESI